MKWIKQRFDYFIETNKQTNKQKNTWSTFWVPSKLLTNLEVAAANSSRHFSRQLQSDCGCLHQQTNLLTVFGPRGFNWQLVRLTSAVRRKIFQSKLNHGKEKLKFLLLFLPSYSFGKLTSKTFCTKKSGIQGGRRHLRLVFSLMLQEYATREADELSQIQLCTFVNFCFPYAFKNESVVLR